MVRRSAAVSLQLPPTASTGTYQRNCLGTQCEEEGRGKETDDAGRKGDAFEGSNDVTMPPLVYQHAAIIFLSFDGVGGGRRGGEGAAPLGGSQRIEWKAGGT